MPIPAFPISSSVQAPVTNQSDDGNSDLPVVNFFCLKNWPKVPFCTDPPDIGAMVDLMQISLWLSSFTLSRRCLVSSCYPMESAPSLTSPVTSLPYQIEEKRILGWLV
ncbi:unnamed protein product [Absidia cylindrospora]